MYEKMLVPCFFWFFGSHESWCLTLTLPGLHGESFETKNRLTTQPDLLTFSQIISRSWWHNSWVLLMFFSNNHGKLPYWRLRSSSSRALFSTSMLGRVIGWIYTPKPGCNCHHQDHYNLKQFLGWGISRAKPLFATGILGWTYTPVN